MRLGVVTGLQREANCLRVFPASKRLAVSCQGVGGKAAFRAAAELLGGGCQALLSFGLAGGLREGLHPGDVVIAEAIVGDDGQALPTDTAWRARLEQVLQGRPTRRLVVARLAGLDRPLLSASDKAACGRRFVAAAVDMESLAVATAAAAKSTPFLAVRVVIDPVDQAVPGWLAAAIDGRGKPRPSRLLAGLAQHPADLPVLLRLARNERKAMRALRDVAVDAGPLFALP